MKTITMNASAINLFVECCIIIIIIIIKKGREYKAERE